MAEEQKSFDGGVIVAKAANDYRWKRYVLVGVLFIYGLMCIRDGFFRYPQENAKAKAENYEKEPHPGFDVQLNQILGVLLPPGSVAFLVWSLYISRGEVRYDGLTLNIPGHPPIPMNSLRQVNRAKWDRKGIAYVDYQIAGTQKGGRFKLDDFIYQREPIDRIFAEIEAVVAPPGSVPPAAAAPLNDAPGT